uniref:Uncharacterized protein n=1 Tax=Globodera rostochiensis TaxID=31243 RepID=A0A914HJU4_GLORO
MGTKKRATALLFSLLWILPFIKVRANEWPGCSVAEKIELLDAVFPKESVIAVTNACTAQADERVAQLEEAKRNAMSPLPSRVFHSAELELKVKAKAAEHFYTHMLEQYNAVGDDNIVKEYVSPFADCASDCAQLVQNLAHAQHELSTLHAVEQEQQHGGKQSSELLMEADMELEALQVALHGVQLALLRLQERHDRMLDWLRPSFYSMVNTLNTFSLHNAMAAEMEKRHPTRAFCFWKPVGADADEEKWENIPL